MQYRKFSDTVVVRHDRGEDIVSNVLKIAADEKITLAEINALGAVNEFTVGALDTNTKKYRSNSFKGEYEIVSLHGSLTEKDGAPYLHLHMAAGDEAGAVVGGHLNKAIVSATCEMFIRILDGKIGRRLDDGVGINIFEF